MFPFLILMVLDMFGIMCIYILQRDIKYPGFVKAKGKSTNEEKELMLEYRVGHQSGQHESYGRNSSARLRSFSLRVYVIVSKAQIHNKCQPKHNIAESRALNTMPHKCKNP